MISGCTQSKTICDLFVLPLIKNQTHREIYINSITLNLPPQHVIPGLPNRPEHDSCFPVNIITPVKQQLRGPILEINKIQSSSVDQSLKLTRFSGHRSTEDLIYANRNRQPSKAWEIVSSSQLHKVILCLQLDTGSLPPPFLLSSWAQFSKENAILWVELHIFQYRCPWYQTP